MSEKSQRNILLLTDQELRWLISDVEQCSFEYYISREYQNFSDKFTKEVQRINS